MGATSHVAAAAKSNTLRPGARLRPGEVRRSRNRRFRLVMQRDGNLVLFRGRRVVLWSSQSHGNPGAFAKMQRDGNLVVYSKAGKALYGTGTQGDARTRLVVRNNGNAVLLSGSGNTLWTSKADVSQLSGGQILRDGQSRRSPNGQYVLAMQRDGNLVLYDEPSRQPLWSSQTESPGAFAGMQRDGNLVVYSESRQVLFVTATQSDQAVRLAVQNDGNAVLYAGSGNALWSAKADVFQLSNGQILRAGQSRRSADGRYLLLMQADGNLVLYDKPGGRPLWSSQTVSAGAFAVMQRDGNLVVYSEARQPLFFTATEADQSARLVVQNDGNAVLYTGAAAALWSSHADVFQLSNGQTLKPGQVRRSPNGRYLLAMQADGNLALYDQSNGHPDWSSQTASAGASATMQRDGNLVVSSAANQPLWATLTRADAGTHLVVQDDGNAVVYSGTNAPLWGSKG